MFWRRREASKAAPPAPVIDPAPLRIMDAKEMAAHVVECLRGAGRRYVLTNDIDQTAIAWCTEHGIEPIHPKKLREQVQCLDDVRYSRRNLSGPEFGSLRRQLANIGKKTDRQHVYEILPDQSRVSPGSVPVQSGPIPIRSRIARTIAGSTPDQKTRAA